MAKGDVAIDPRSIPVSVLRHLLGIEQIMLGFRNDIRSLPLARCKLGCGGVELLTHLKSAHKNIPGLI